MARRRARVWAAVAGLWLAAGLGGVASAQTPAEEQYGVEVEGGEIPALDHRCSWNLEEIQHLPDAKSVALALYLKHDNGALVGGPRPARPGSG